LEAGEYEFHFSQGDSDWWQRGMRRCTLAMLDGVPPGRALDLGAGCGYFVRDLRARGFDATGVEMEAAATAGARRLGVEPYLVVGDLNDHLGGSQIYSLVTCLDVLPHKSIDQNEVLRKVFRSLLPGGHLLLRLPAHRFLYGPHDQFVHQVRRYDKADVLAMAEQHEFRIARLSYGNSLLSPVFATIMWHARNDPPKSFSARTSDATNKVLSGIMALEGRWLEAGWNLPWGISLLVLLQRPHV
jgi:SAM-dependent methyltransferase